jgi:hypothetical protein
MTHKLFENLIPPHYSEQLLLEFSRISWMFTPSAANVEDNYDKNDTNIRNSVQFVHGITDMNKPVSPMHPLVLPILWFFEKETGLQIKNIMRIKANCLTRDGFEVKYNSPHIDIYEKGYTSLIYYINDSDGDTILFDKTIDQGFTDLKIIKRVTPKKGNAFMIPSNQLHASSCPIDTKQRMVINFVLELE